MTSAFNSVIILKVGCGFSQTVRTHCIIGEIVLDRKKGSSEMKIYWARHGTRSQLSSQHSGGKCRQISMNLRLAWSKPHNENLSKKLIIIINLNTYVDF